MSGAAETMYRDLVDRGLEAAFLTRPDGTILYANPAACELVGYSLQELQTLGREAVVESGDPRLQAALKERARTGRFRGVIAMRHKNGSTFPASISSAVFIDADGEERTSMYVRRLESGLPELVPICAYCKRVRDESAQWHPVEVLVSSELGVRFSHGICPHCYAEEFAAGPPPATDRGRE